MNFGLGQGLRWLVSLRWLLWALPDLHWFLLIFVGFCRSALAVAGLRCLHWLLWVCVDCCGPSLALVGPRWLLWVCISCCGNLWVYVGLCWRLPAFIGLYRFFNT